MSTISEALKKVQTQRSPGTPPPLPASPQRGPRAPWLLLILLAGGLVLVAGLYRFRESVILGGWHSLSAAGQMPRSASSDAGVSGVGAAAPTRASWPAAPVAALEVKIPAPMPARVEQVALAPVVTNPAPEALPLVTNDLPTLTGIFYGERNPVAIIDGQALKEGEKVGRFEIVKIEVLCVTLKGPEGLAELRLK